MIGRLAALMGGAALAALGTTAATAQAGSAGAPQRPDTGAASAAPADIVVTAQRRAERAQDVPIVVTAFSAERLEKLNVHQPQDLYGNVPSLVSGTQGQASRDVQSYSIRGQSTGYLASPGVALYLNEVPLPSAVLLSLQGGPGNFVDLENVQVLSGPQGTLFGRNTTGGAVLLQPHKPTNQLGGYLEGSVGNYDLRSLEGALNIPLVEDKLMVRVAGAYYDRRGYTKDLIWDKWRDNQHWYTGRIGVMFRPSDRFENYLFAYGTRSSNNGSGNINAGFNIAALQAIRLADGTPAPFCIEGAGIPGAVVSCDVYRRQTQIQQQIGPRRMRGNVDAFSRIETWGITNTSAYRLTDELTLRNIVSYQKLRDNAATDQDGTPLQQYDVVQNAREPDFPVPGLAEYGLPLTGTYGRDAGFNLPVDHIKQFTEELQLQGNMLDNHLTFTAGGFYYDARPEGLWGFEAINYCPAAFTGLCAPQQIRNDVRNKSKALYAQATLDLGAVVPALEKLRLTGGFRYTWDTIIGFHQAWQPNPDGLTASCLVNGTTPGNVPLADISQCAFTATLRSKAPTWTLGADYKPLRNLLVYAKVSRGYKAGGFNASAVRERTQTFQPEKLLTYEAGFKSDWHLGTMPLHLNATYYYSDYNNIQRPGADFNTSTGAAGAIILAAKARIQGIELETSLRPVRSLEIGGTLSYTDAKYKKYQTVVYSPTPACNGLIPAGGTADLSCAPFQFVTPWIYSIHALLDVPMPERLGALSLYTAYNHVSSQYTAPTPGEPGGFLKGYGLLSATLTWSDVARSGLDISLFGTNLTNKLYRVSNSNSSNTLLVLSTLYGEPRMFGLKLRYNLGR